MISIVKNLIEKVNIHVEIWNFVEIEIIKS